MYERAKCLSEFIYKASEWLTLYNQHPFCLIMFVNLQQYPGKILVKLLASYLVKCTNISLSIETIWLSSILNLLSRVLAQNLFDILLVFITHRTIERKLLL